MGFHSILATSFLFDHVPVLPMRFTLREPLIALHSSKAVAVEVRSFDHVSERTLE